MASRPSRVTSKPPRATPKQPRTRRSDPLNQLMRKTFGIKRLRPGQLEVIANVLSGRDTLAIMPTGAGKSLCYQLPALHMPGTTVVVSPLISLMKDQVDKLLESGVSAVQLNSTLTSGDETSALQAIADGKSEFVFTTPERLSDPQFIATLQRNAVDVFVIDEAHCISQWGHDFRPAFLDISVATEALGSPPVLALTATATQVAIEDIAKQLNLPDMEVINTGIYRANLRYDVAHMTNDDEKRAKCRGIVRDETGSIIIYAATVKAVEELHDFLRDAGESVGRYHGRLPSKERKSQQDAFMSGASKIMVATNAFGMGIDKADIRSIIRYQIPGSLEAYYQESGRAGRDGEPARCTLLYDTKDKRVQQFFLVRRYPSISELDQLYRALETLTVNANETTLEALHKQLPSLPLNRIRVALKQMKDGGLVNIKAGSVSAASKHAITEDFLSSLANQYLQKDERDRDTLERMIFYAQSGACRWKTLLEYFGEDVAAERCGHCDNCLQAPAPIPVRTLDSSPESAIQLPEAARFDEGEVVKVRKYGRGTVTAATAADVTIAFSNGQTRTFADAYVKPAGTRSRTPALRGTSGTS